MHNLHCDHKETRDFDTCEWCVRCGAIREVNEDLETGELIEGPWLAPKK